MGTHWIATKGVDGVADLHDGGSEGGICCGVGHRNIEMLEEDDRVSDDALETSVGQAVVGIAPCRAHRDGSGKRGESRKAEKLHRERVTVCKLNDFCVGESGCE